MLSFLRYRVFISNKRCLRPRNRWNCFGDFCVVFLCLLAACEFFMTSHFFFLSFFLRRGFGMNSNLWYKYRLLVLGSITYTLKPLNSKDKCSKAALSTCVTLKNTLRLWEQLTKFWKDAIGFRLVSASLMCTGHPSQGDCRALQALRLCSRSPLPSFVRILQFPSTQWLSAMIYFFVSLFLKCEALGPNYSKASGLPLISSRFIGCQNTAWLWKILLSVLYINNYYLWYRHTIEYRENHC